MQDHRMYTQGRLADHSEEGLIHAVVITIIIIMEIIVTSVIVIMIILP